MEQLRHAVREQTGLVAMMFRRLDLFVPMLAIWVASFGGALHAPVTTYFQMEVGASTTQIGNFGVIKTIGVLLMSPVYGWLLDTKSAYYPAVLSSFCCTFGCLFQGFAPDVSALYLASIVLGLGAANFWNVVGAYTALATPRDYRPVVVSGFQVQVAILRLLGTSLYPSLDSIFLHGGLDDKLLRYRFHMSICSFFCVFGFIYMVVRFRPVARMDTCDGERENSKMDEPINKFQLILLLSTLVVQAFGETVVTVLWPLHIRKLGWDSHEYAYLQLASQLLVIAGTVGYPPLTRVLGQRATASILPLVGSFTCAIAFLQPDPSLYGQMLHSFNALAFLSICGTMKVCFQHLTTVSVPPAMQGRIFSLLNMLSSLGAIAGNLFGTRLSEHETSFAGKGATPFLLASSLFFTIGAVIVAALITPCEDCHMSSEDVPQQEEMKRLPAEQVGSSRG